MFKQLTFILLVLAFCCGKLSAQEKANTTKTVTDPLLKGLNIQLLQAFHLNTLGLSVEYPVSSALAINVSCASTFGKNQGAKQHFVTSQDYTKQGVRAQLAANYFFKNNAPEGLYAQAQVSYNTIIYYDGTTRPYSLFNHRKDVSQLGNGELVTKGKKVDMGIGLGYQTIMIKDHVIANLLIGLQGNQSADNQLFITMYIRPTIGFIF